MRLSPAQVRFLQVCCAEPDGCSIRPGSVMELLGGRPEKALVRAWYRTMKSLQRLGLVQYGSRCGFIVATITQAGRAALAAWTEQQTRKAHMRAS